MAAALLTCRFLYRRGAAEPVPKPLQPPLPVPLLGHQRGDRENDLDVVQGIDPVAMFVFDKSKSSAAIKQWRLTEEGGQMRTTLVRQITDVSIGVAERSEKAPDPEAVLKAADKALYRAKKAGRNRVAK